MYVPCTCQGESRISLLMTLSGPDTQRTLLRGRIQGDWTMWIWHRGCQSCDGGAVCVQVCVWDRENGDVCARKGKGRLSMMLSSTGYAWMKLLPGPCPSVTVAAAVTKMLPWQGGHKKVWRGNRSRGQEWGSGGQGSQPAGQHTRGGQGEKRRREDLLFFFFALSSLGFCMGGRRLMSGQHWPLTLNWGGEMKKGRRGEM